MMRKGQIFSAFMATVTALLIAPEFAIARIKPVVLTRSQIDVNGDRKPDTVLIQMISGKRYDPGERGGCDGGDKYEGMFQIVVQIKGGKTTYQNLNQLFGARFKGGNLYFKAQPWKIHFDNYTHDGRVNFNLGQYRACNGWAYKLFAIEKNGRVRLLGEPSTGFYVADFANSSNKVYSIPTGFAHTFYNNGEIPGELPNYVTKRYGWNRAKQGFTLIEKTSSAEPPPQPLEAGAER